MNIRLDYIMAVLFTVALFVPVPSWYVTLELILGWLWFGCLVIASIVLFGLIANALWLERDYLNSSFERNAILKFTFHKDLISLAVSCIILYSTSMQGFAGLFVSLLIMLVFFHTLKAINWYLRQAKKST